MDTSKIKYTVSKIKIKRCLYNEYSRPLKLISSKNSEYTFPNMVATNRLILIKLTTFLNGKKITIVHDNMNRIHKIENIPLSWHVPNYNLMVLSYSKGLIFDEHIEVNAFENISIYFKKYGYEKFICDGYDVLIIIKDTLSEPIPHIY